MDHTPMNRNRALSRDDGPMEGTYADGFEPLARCFAAHLRDRREIGAGVCVYHRGNCVVDLWGGLADAEARKPWTRDTRVVVFSATKGLAAMALTLVADRGDLSWDAPVAAYWPGFARAGKGAMTVRTLLNHQGGVLALDRPLSVAECLDPNRAAHVRRVLEDQCPAWEPGKGQGYHAITFGMYARELFEIVAKEPMGAFLRREVFDPLKANVSLGTPSSEDTHVARLYPPEAGKRILRMIAEGVRGGSTESRVARALLTRGSLVRGSFGSAGATGVAAYNDIPIRRGELAWGSATATAHGLARAYLPFAAGGTFEGRVYARPGCFSPIHARQSWSDRDYVLQKPLGWSQGFLKEETHLFSPNRESFGHAGMGGALGWCDPVMDLTFGYVMNRMDWRVRSPRAIALCRALYACEPIKA